MNSVILEEIRLLINPPETELFRRKINSSLANNLSHWITSSGQCETRQLPTYSETNIVEVSVTTQDDETIPYSLKLPFNLISGTGTFGLLENGLNRKLEKIKPKLSEYLDNLSANPSLNPEFEKFLIENKATYDRKGEKMIIKETKNPRIILPPEETPTYDVDYEGLNMLLLKIAWTHAVKQLDRKILSDLIIQKILSDYLTSGDVRDKKLIEKYPDLFTNSVNIEGEEYNFWKHSINESLSWIEKHVDIITDYEHLMMHHMCRINRFNSAKEHIELINQIELLDNKLRDRANQFKFHELNLKNIKKYGREITACTINLYGGLISAIVHIADKPLAEIYPANIRIDFKEMSDQSQF